MGGRIIATRLEEVERTWIHADWEYSHRLVTRKREGCESFSFHITTYMPNFDRVVKGDGVHEVVLFCLEGESHQILADGTVINFAPGTATYLPREYEYRHVVGQKGLKVAVACSPPRE